MTAAPGAEPRQPEVPQRSQRPVAFLPFDEQRAVRIYQRHMPHWRQEGCTYFVTFRLADSIPANVRRSWEYEQRKWLEARGIVCKPGDFAWREQVGTLASQERFLFERHFNRKVQACLDRGLGNCWLRDRQCIDALATELMRHDAIRYHLGDYVIMPNHVHLLITPIVGYELEWILKAIKGKAAIECNILLERSGAFWQSESYDHIVRSLEQLVAYREYIASNPQRAGLQLTAFASHRAGWLDAWLM